MTSGAVIRRGRRHTSSPSFGDRFIVKVEVQRLAANGELSDPRARARRLIASADTVSRALALLASCACARASAQAQAQEVPRTDAGVTAPAPLPTTAVPADASAIAPPAVISKVDAVYPPSALAQRREGSVVLLVTIDTGGRVTDATPAQSAGEDFDQAAIAAVRQWTFTPALRGGAPVESRIRVPFSFVLPAIEAPPATPVQPPPLPTASASPAPAPSQTPRTETPVDVTVRGPPRQLRRGSSDFQIDVGALAAVPRENATQMLELAPGVLLTNEGGEAHAEQVFLRGFDAREGQDIEFSVGGVPINEAGNLHGNGYADAHFIIPELVSSLRVIEGPFDPRQGNFAVAGSADYELGLADRGVTLEQGYGSFNTSRTLVLWGPEGAERGTFAGADLYRTDGFGENRDGSRASAMAQYEGVSGSHRYRVGASAYTASFHSAGVLRKDDYDAGRVGFFDTYDPAQGEDSARYSLYAALQSRFDALLVENQVFVIARPLRLRENFTGFLLDPQEPQQTPHDQRGDLLDLAITERTIGARGFGRTAASVLGQRQTLEVGYFARGDFVDGTQSRVEAATLHPYHVDESLDSTLGDVGLYGDLDVRATRWLGARGGVRADLFSYDVLDRCAAGTIAHPSRANPPGDQSCPSQEDFGAYREPFQRSTTTGAALAPRASLIVGPFHGLSASASYGRGFRSIDPVYVSQDAKTPFARAESLQAGLDYDLALGSIQLAAQATLFETRVDRDLIFSESAGRNILGGASTRVGGATSLRAGGRFFDVAANATYVRATFDDTGLLIPYIPDFVFRFDGALFDRDLLPRLNAAGHALHGRLGTGISVVTPRALPYGERGAALFTADASAAVGWWLFELGVSCTNLFDTRYRLGEFNYVSDFHGEPFPTLVPVRHFSAGAPRTFFVTLALHFGGES
jgi:TonB family protein